jgi:hypothetical protein
MIIKVSKLTLVNHRSPLIETKIYSYFNNYILYGAIIKISI